MNEIAEGAGTAEELQQISGGVDPVPRVVIHCARCADTASKGGFVVHNERGSLLRVRFSSPLCEACAGADLALYERNGWKFECWL